ncbi:MAG: hypothetical protein Q7W38_10160 [Deltaproteobacteria bacterium]|nr:hypothetical protein [Deltaproteobacteria bacterium]
MGRNDDDDREKLSWREIDKRRDRTRHYSNEGKSFKERTLRSDWAKKQHLREAEKFFQGKKGTEAYKAAHAALHEKYGTGDFQVAVENFLQQFGLPDDWGTLLLILDAHEPKWVQEALMPLKELYAKRSLIEQKGFKGKVKVLAMTTKDKNIRQECEKILEGL